MALAHKTMASKMASRPLRTGRVSRGAIRVSAAAAKWLPGSEQPAWLPETLPGTFGFDPMGLAKEPASLQRFQEAELVHCRWAMLGAAGVLAVELFGFGNWVNAQSQILETGRATYFGATNPFDLNTLVAVEFLAFAASEVLRGSEPDAEKRKYPGGPFDFAGLSKGANADEYKLKEIKNGRLAMLANLGFFAQYQATGKSPLTALNEHLADPWANNFATNHVSLPGF